MARKRINVIVGGKEVAVPGMRECEIRDLERQHDCKPRERRYKPSRARRRIPKDVQEA